MFLFFFCCISWFSFCFGFLERFPTFPIVLKEFLDVSPAKKKEPRVCPRVMKCIHGRELFPIGLGLIFLERLTFPFAWRIRLTYNWVFLGSIAMITKMKIMFVKNGYAIILRCLIPFYSLKNSQICLEKKKSSSK